MLKLQKKDFAYLDQIIRTMHRPTNQYFCIRFLTNLGDEISIKGGRICKAKNWYKKKNNKMNK